jgi:hypothetical protein
VLDNHEATTFWRLQESFAREGASRGIRLVSDRLAVDAGRVVTATGSGIEGALLVLGKLHGEAWKRLTALHMDVNPDHGPETTIRSKLADRNLPVALDEYIPDAAELIDYSGGRESWNQHWRYTGAESAHTMTTRFAEALQTTAHWRRVGSASTNDSSTQWAFTGLDGATWRGAVQVDKIGDMVELTVQVWKGTN